MLTPTQLPEEPKGVMTNNAKTKFNARQTKMETPHKPAMLIEAETGIINPKKTVLHQNLIMGKLQVVAAAPTDTAKTPEETNNNGNQIKANKL